MERPLVDIFADDLSHWRSEGIVGDGFTDDGPAINAYMSRVSQGGGGTIRLRGSFYIATNLAVPSGVTLDGQGATVLHFGGASYRGFTMSNATLAGLRGITFNLSASSATAGYVGYIADCTDCIVEDCVFLAPRGEVYLTGASSGNQITHNAFTGSLGNAVHLDGANVTGNVVGWNEISGSAGFGIFGQNGMHHNLLVGNRTFSNGIELIGLRYDCHHNRVVSNHAEGTGDNGISITGKHNVVTGNVCRRNAFSGIGVYGSYNSITGNVCTSNGQDYPIHGGTHSGIVVLSAFGGLAQNNTIVGNTTDDDQASPTQSYGVQISGANSMYQTWAQGQVYAANSYCKNGTAIYRTLYGGTTGAVAPVHPAGSVSDGGVEWLYLDSWPSGREPVGNMVGPNACYRSRSGTLSDTTVNNLNTVIDLGYVRVSNIAANTSNRVDQAGIYRHLQPWVNAQAVTYGAMRYAASGHIYRCTNVGGTCSVQPSHTLGTVTGADGIAWLLVTQNVREHLIAGTPNGPALNIDAVVGVGRVDAIATFAQIYAGSGSPEGVVTAPVGSIFMRTDGAQGSTLYTKSGTGSTGWHAVTVS